MPRTQLTNWLTYVVAALAVGMVLYRFIMNGDLISVTGVASLSMLMSPGIDDPILYIFPVICIGLLALILVVPYKPFGEPPAAFGPWYPEVRACATRASERFTPSAGHW